MDKGRLEAFSDGVLAVAITLLVLDLHIDPHEGSIPHQLAEHWTSYAAYVVSFLVIGVIWVNHHALLSRVAQVDRVLLFENLVLLMFVTTLPFTTATLADHVGASDADARWAVLLYGLSNIGMAVGFTAMFARMVRRDLLVEPIEAGVGRRAVRRFGLGTLAYPAATVVGLVWPPLILAAMGGLALYYAFEQTPTGAIPPRSTS
ncbi:MAG: TMEM175 family protein [Gordonia paraffinivorans]